MQPAPYGGASWIDYDTPSDAQSADDWLCTTPGWLSDIHFAGWSYYGNQYIDAFRVSVWTDVPAIPGYDESHPGSQLWSRDFTLADPLDPHKIGYQDLGDGTFRINIAENDWFYQQGTPDNPLIYWISIQGVMRTDGAFDGFYWNFRDPAAGHLLDDAAFASNYFGYPPWASWYWQTGLATTNLYDYYPPPQDYAQSADMAFALTFIPEPASLLLVALGGLLLRRR